MHVHRKYGGDDGVYHLPAAHACTAWIGQDCTSQVEILKLLCHTNIVKYHDHCYEDGRLNIIMEFADGGSLENRIQRQQALKQNFQECTVLDVLSQLLAAVAYMHDMLVLHRDIKPDNVFLMRDDTVKLGDFGISRQIEIEDSSTPQRMAGTPHYLAECSDMPVLVG